MPVWWWENREETPERLRARQLVLVLAGSGGELEQHAPLLRPFIPAVDAVLLPPEAEGPAAPGPLPVLRADRPIGLPDLLDGRLASPLRARERLLWLRPGDTLLTGGDGGLLRTLAQPELAGALAPVHYPWGDGLTLLALEPRLLSSRGPITRYAFAPLPVQAEGTPVDPESYGRQPRLAWEVLCQGIHLVLTGRAGPGADRLRALSGQMRSSAPVTGLVLRNLIAIELGCGADRRAEQLLAEGLRSHPQYGELRLLQAVRLLLAGRYAEAETALTVLLEQHAPPEAGYLSGGGEQSYRLLDYRGRARLRQGNLLGAITDWSAALRLEPHYLPPLAAIAEQRLHADTLAELGLDRLFRIGTPRACELVLQAHARGSDPTAATALAARWRYSGAPAVPHAPAGHSPDRAVVPAGIRWEGPFFSESSLALVNRELALRLVLQGWDLGLLPSQPQDYAPDRDHRFLPLAERLWGGSDAPALIVSHRYPPALHPQRNCRQVVYLPWEFGALPRRWVEGLARVDEVWTYSEHVRAGVLASGVLPEKVHVVPCGFDPAIFHPGVMPAPPVATDFLFLYVGGLILRKGYDLALDSFLAEFGPEEDVVLLFKDFGSQSFYRRQTGLERVRQAVADTAHCARRVQVIEPVLAASALAQLYRAASCLLAPYRAEGFCLPVLEAMACGVPAIITASGPAPEYAPPGTALPVAAAPVFCGTHLEGLELVAPGTWAEVDRADLRRQMRWAVEHRDELAAIGRRAAASVHAHYSWDRIAAQAGARLSGWLAR